VMKPGDIIEWSDGKSEPHRWRVRGVYLGATGVESLVELANVSHQPGNTEMLGKRYSMLVPECLLRTCKIVQEIKAEFRTAEARHDDGDL